MKNSTIKTAINTVIAKSFIESIKIENNNLFVTDLSTTLIIKNIGLDGAFCVDAKQYLNVLGLCDNFTASVIDTKVYFESGKDIFSYPTGDINDFPHQPGETRFNGIGSINEADLNRITTAAKFISTDDLRPAMCNVAITKGLIAGTDAHKLFFEKSDLQTIEHDILINKKTCKLLDLFNTPAELLEYLPNKDSEDFRGTYLDAGYIKFDCEDFTIIQRGVNERYPDILAIIPESQPNSCTVDKKQLNDSLKKALTCANKVTNQVKFHINGALAISSEDIDLCTEYSTSIPAKNTGETIDIGFNGKFVQSVLSEIDSDQITFTMSAPNRAAIFNGNILLMPVMLGSYKY